MMPDMSVVIPTFMRDELLARCLERLSRQTLSPSRYEIIVVDDAGNAGTRELVGQRRPRLRMGYIAMPGRRGPAAARNRGWRAARGKVIAFTDDDCLPSERWLEEGWSAFTGGAAGVSGKIIVPLASPPTDYEYTVARLEEAEFATANCFYLREALVAVGGFDETFTQAWREDADLFFTLLEQGRTMRFVDNAVVVHPARPRPWGISIREQRKSMFNALLFKKHPALFRERIQRTPPWHYYGAVLSLGAGSAGMALGHGYLALAGAVSWVLATLIFCARRLKYTSRSLSHVAEMLVTSLVIPPLSLFWRFYGAVKFRVAFW